MGVAKIVEVWGMIISETDVRRRRVLDTAQQLCMVQGSVGGDEVAAATSIDLQKVIDCLAELARAGSLIVRPGGRYARPLMRQVRMPGESYVSAIPPASLTRLMAAR